MKKSIVMLLLAFLLLMLGAAESLAAPVTHDNTVTYSDAIAISSDENYPDIVYEGITFTAYTDAEAKSFTQVGDWATRDASKSLPLSGNYYLIKDVDKRDINKNNPGVSNIASGVFLLSTSLSIIFYSIHTVGHRTHRYTSSCNYCHTYP